MCVTLHSGWGCGSRCVRFSSMRCACGGDGGEKWVEEQSKQVCCCWWCDNIQQNDHTTTICATTCTVSAATPQEETPPAAANTLKTTQLPPENNGHAPPHTPSSPTPASPASPTPASPPLQRVSSDEGPFGMGAPAASEIIPPTAPQKNHHDDDPSPMPSPSSKPSSKPSSVPSTAPRMDSRYGPFAMHSVAPAMLGPSPGRQGSWGPFAGPSQGGAADGPTMLEGFRRSSNMSGSSGRPSGRGNPLTMQMSEVTEFATGDEVARSGEGEGWEKKTSEDLVDRPF